MIGTAEPYSTIYNVFKLKKKRNWIQTKLHIKWLINFERILNGIYILKADIAKGIMIDGGHLTPLPIPLKLYQQQQQINEIVA